MKKIWLCTYETEETNRIMALMMNYKHDALVAICGGHQTDHKIATFLSFVSMLSQTCARTHIVHVYGATFLEAVFTFLKIQLPN